MKSRRQTWFLGITLSLCVMAANVSAARAQYGIVLSGAGPINRSMGGASSAPLDASGALYWNPATISGLPGSELEIGAEFLYPQAHLSSSLALFGLSGSDRSDNGVCALPTVGLVYRPQDSALTYGLGFFAAGGFNVNYPASVTNPILMAQPVGLGPLSAELQVMQIVPTVSWQLTDHLAIGFSPTVNMANLKADPFFVASPIDVNGVPMYPPGTHTRLTWGLGFQVGLYYQTDSSWHFGASVKSPQWFEQFRFDVTDGLGQPHTLKFHLDYPMMVSAGVGYTGFERLTLAVDCRFIDYHNTEGFDQSGFDATGAVTGLGWKSVFVVAAGAQYQLTDCVSARVGYSFNTNPIDSANTSFNVASPLILQHTVYVGASYACTESLLVSLAYAHAFENTVEGPIETPFGPIPGSSVQSSVRADTVMLGATVKY